ncbi:hypothetical protein B296_00029672 [Ensete ventricosum]|uniref:Uncharacterized protein n=1 Tax=Ensete ventricosum TaxID=4639 RepID=A0A427A563_ENSVE|nr:hypothetical protein B296_00029672 [Ensete ventricosum]
MVIGGRHHAVPLVAGGYPLQLGRPYKGPDSGDHRCRWPGRGWPPLLVACPQVATPLLTAFAENQSKNT